ncbi:MAG: 5-(carboxyamino)imidazole ribonucleotide synthase [Phycisphaeraceae bacterium]|nr:5-(carboxyamino)imidazole ribonucleotide synthase [Phycisphaeraceae bacterium]
MIDQPSIEPGATLGVWGGGQLGMMFVQAASAMGYRTAVYSPDPNAPACAHADMVYCGDYEDIEQVWRFAKACDVTTLEFEDVPVTTLQWASAYTLVRPGINVLKYTQNRALEKQFLLDNHLPCVPHVVLESVMGLHTAVKQIGIPCVLKTVTNGYDGHGQYAIHHPGQVHGCWQKMGRQQLICEQWIDHQCELSVLVARSAGGQMVTFGPIVNEHHNHVLDISSVPGDLHPSVTRQATALAEQVALSLDLVGIIAVEMYLLPDNRLLINEIAPRPHNSGHLTLQATDASQFQQQVRAICNLPLMPMQQEQPAVMVNIMGDLWEFGEPDFQQLRDLPNVHLHLYGKIQARPGRKMGHITCLAESVQAARQLALEARRKLRKTRPKSTHDDSRQEQLQTS